ncbi:MAG: ABC transporter ATP-binding protein [Chitinophagaceae bacterium]|nr:MAG: ABC transporter ATP-binding protein [Chitinophagaceae bacterium]
MSLLRRSWRLLDGPEQRRYVLLSVADALVQLLDIAFLAALLLLVKRLLQKEAIGPLPVPLLLLLFFAAFLAKNGCGLAAQRALHAFAGRVSLRLSGRQLEACQQAAHVQFLHSDTSVLIRKVNFHPVEFAHYILLGLQQIAAQLLLIAASVAAVLLYDPALFALVVAVLLPPAFFLFRGIKRRIDRSKDTVKDANEASLRCLLDALKGQPEAKVYGRQGFFRDRPDAGAYLLLRAGAFLAAAYKVIPGLVKIIGASGQLRAWSFTLDEAPLLREQPVASGPIRKLEVSGVRYAWDRKPLFGNLSFEAFPGDIVLLESPSGSGKTTLLHLLLGFIEPQAGAVRINGVRVRPGNAAAFWTRTAYVRQDAFLIQDSVARNITFEEEPQDPQRLQAVLRATGLLRMLAATGDTPDKLVLENGRNLSGGQQQRIALARALYRRADLYLLDEPFNELDRAAVDELQVLLQDEAAAGKIVIVVTHQPETIPGARRIRIHGKQAQPDRTDHARLRSL